MVSARLGVRVAQQANEQDVAHAVQHPPHVRPSASCLCLPRMYEVRTLSACLDSSGMPKKPLRICASTGRALRTPRLSSQTRTPSSSITQTTPKWKTGLSCLGYPAVSDCSWSATAADRSVMSSESSRPARLRGASAIPIHEGDLCAKNMTSQRREKIRTLRS